MKVIYAISEMLLGSLLMITVTAVASALFALFLWSMELIMWGP